MGKLSNLRSLTSFFVGNERGFLLAELGGMRLREDLEMKNLGRVKSVKDAMEANMSSKRLKELRLSWDRNEETKLGEKAEEILEVLQPDIQQLVSLTVTGYTGGRFPRWLFSGSLKKLQIERCKELKGFHESLESMTGLHSLRLCDLPNNQLLKRLERLDIYACPALEELICHSSTVLPLCEIRVDGRLSYFRQG
ncbi:hypothetical protein VIGAN_10104000 [Vigna angularis var. angularis]|uniref:R13L1/DRL21-like LRR repeat region domain-containing protein n=1 Tax=Vigna angularis var. angularis TaxID=157739 RepID=A0A0S3T3I6_PHAAN|nr:hypothetical protein VIGAN_10104000 [Vigna angularis var. angularis]